ncbi:MAG: response regulator transcription factor [Opitutaceae bacterium]
MRALIVEDQGMFRDLLAKVCKAHFRFSRVHAVACGAAAEEAFREEPFDLVILDIDLPDRDGFDLAELASTLEHPPRSLGISAFCDEFMVHRVMNSSMHGFLDKSEQSVETLRDAIEAVCAGRYYFTAAVKRVQRAMREDPHAFPKILSRRDCQLLSLFGAGKSNDEVATLFGLTPHTVQWRRKQIMRKLDLHSAVDLVLFAVEKGFSRPGGGVRGPQSQSLR